MCGIIGINSNEEFYIKDAVKRLKRLEYRGYDSFGYYDGTILFNQVGHIKIPNTDDKSSRIILHTRWATHGGVTKFNAHPHQSTKKKVTIAHNGIIKNYEELREKLIKKGHEFTSETDSETTAHYFEEKLKTKTIKEACIDFLNDIEGEFALVIMVEGNENIYALRRDSPLVLGVGTNTNYVASDIYAFSDITNMAIFFENNEFAEIGTDHFQFYDKKGQKIQKEVQTFKWEQEESTLQNYDHFMMKEIMEEPIVVKRLLFSLKTEQKINFEKFIDLMRKAKKVTFVAAGTSYHASLLGVYYLHKCGIEAQTIIASEFEHFIGVDKDTLVIPISQSGETMDVIEALKYATKHGAKIASIVNVPYSTIQRISEISLNIFAGQEICVAATKSFVNQVTLMLAIAKEFGYNVNLENLPQRIEEVFTMKETIKEIAKTLFKQKHLYVLGRGLSYPVAREIALKIKEISYIHAEGMMGGELKHGTIALIEKGTPVIGLLNENDYDMRSNLKEVAARGANVISISNKLKGDIMISTSNDGKFGILASIVGQLLTYYLARELKLPIDKPRNLAKSVTVK
ncbi:glutamine--fructose-6-phosphate transaminase (isomerizing) [archaeon]|jgi:glutamine---fructose-6-phosphate transaminase (isomerizing)|nr:glutamine--fructose-6-phosphate transaminase (isomerizing) [archaeon]MBT4023043.1 glutamine--fructose-6-phosphate transaminase (isomerizing) [archaeon]MBT4272442.1 glutamine--fructose-6-phosphate transaminase (isomerizing) [archaeon]MBT4460540.1 glutamine--fructose-6-phosphate transaminase (isomerizing) [archaeon]MBT4857870.1 glutamine--fructose-6-phosphate transaminase (isomerizing) [archaeon]